MKTILITGASGGIGGAIAKQLADDDTTLLLHSYSHTATSIPKAAHTKQLVADLSDKAQVEHLAEKMQHEAVDIFVHAVSLPLSYQDLQAKQLESFEKQFRIQVLSFIALAQAVLPGMQQRGGGKIIAIVSDSINGRPPNGLSDYVAAKAALAAAVKSIAAEWARHGIRCNGVSPGMTDTALHHDSPQKLKQLTAESTPAKRIATPDDVAATVRFLCSPEADFINGEIFLVNGGNVMR